MTTSQRGEILCRRKIGTLAIEWWLRQTRYGLGRVGLSCWCRAGVKTAGGVGGGCTWIIPSALALARVDIRTSLRYGVYVVRLIHASRLGSRGEQVEGEAGICYPDDEEERMDNGNEQGRKGYQENEMETG